MKNFISYKKMKFAQFDKLKNNSLNNVNGNSTYSYMRYKNKFEKYFTLNSINTN